MKRGHQPLVTSVALAQAAGKRFLLRNGTKRQLAGQTGNPLACFRRIARQRALEDWPDITFTDDRDGCLFVSTVLRKPAVSGVGDALTGANAKGSEKTPGKTLGKTPGKIIGLLLSAPTLSIPELALALSRSESAIERAARKLRESGHLIRIGPAKGGHWEVVDNQNQMQSRS